MIENHLTVSEAAEYFGVSRQRMHQLIHSYDVPVVDVSPKLKMIRRSHLKMIPKDRPPGPRKK